MSECVIGRDITARARGDWTLSVAGHLPIMSAQDIADSNRLLLQRVVREPPSASFTPQSLTDLMSENKFSVVFGPLST